MGFVARAHAVSDAVSFERTGSLINDQKLVTLAPVGSITPPFQNLKPSLICLGGGKLPLAHF